MKVKKHPEEFFIVVIIGKLSIYFSQVQEFHIQFLFFFDLVQEFIEQGGFALGFGAVDKENCFGSFIEVSF
jgi:hypothetical protein